MAASSWAHWAVVVLVYTLLFVGVNPKTIEDGVMLAVMMVCASVCIRLFGWLLGTYGWLGIACACAPVCIFGILCLFGLWHMNARDSYYASE